MHTYICLYREVCLSLWDFCLEGFVRGGFCPSPLLSEYIRYNRKLKITFKFRFHMYEKNLKSVTSHAPCPCLKLSHLLGPLPPPESVTYFMDGPKRRSTQMLYYLQFISGR